MITIKKCQLIESRKVTTEHWKDGKASKKVETFEKWRVNVSMADPLIKDEVITKSLVVYVKNGQPTNLGMFWTLKGRYEKLLGPYWYTMNVVSDTEHTALKDEAAIKRRRRLVTTRSNKFLSATKKADALISQAIKKKRK